MSEPHLPINLAYALPDGSGISMMIGEDENVLVRFLTHQQVHPYLSFAANSRIHLRISVKHNSLKIIQLQQGDEGSPPACLILNTSNGSMCQLLYLPTINQIHVTFDMRSKLESMGPVDIATDATWFNIKKPTLPETRGLESVSTVKIIISVADTGLATRIVQSFQAVFGVRRHQGSHQGVFRELWEYTKAKMANPPEEADDADDADHNYQQTWDRNMPVTQPSGLMGSSLSPIGSLPTIEEESEEDEDGGVRLTQ